MCYRDHGDQEKIAFILQQTCRFCISRAVKAEWHLTRQHVILPASLGTTRAHVACCLPVCVTCALCRDQARESVRAAVASTHTHTHSAASPRSATMHFLFTYCQKQSPGLRFTSTAPIDHDQALAHAPARNDSDPESVSSLQSAWIINGNCDLANDSWICNPLFGNVSSQADCK